MLIPIGSNEPLDQTWATITLIAICVGLHFFVPGMNLQERADTAIEFCDTPLKEEINEALARISPRNGNLDECMDTVVEIMSGDARRKIEKSDLPADEKRSLKSSLNKAEKQLDFWKGRAFNPKKPTLLTLFSSSLFHSGWMHLIGNMLFLWIFGRILEAEMGALPMLGVFIGSHIFATLAYWLIAMLGITTALPSLGASAGIYGIMAGVWRKEPGTKINCLFLFFAVKTIQIPAPYLIGFYVFSDIFSLLTASNSGVNFIAHLAGFACVYFLLDPAPVRKNPFTDV